MSSLEPFASNIDLLLQATPGKPRSAGLLDSDPDSGHSEPWTDTAIITNNTDEFRRASYTEAPFFTPPASGTYKRNSSVKRESSSDSIDAGVELTAEGQGDDAMSPSLSSNCVEMNGISVESRVQQALAEQEQVYQGRLDDKDRKIKELEDELAKITLVQQEKEQAEKESANSSPDEGLVRVLAEYEVTMASYIQQVDDLARRLEESDREKFEYVKERDQALEDLSNVETAFSDVHRKYERAKAILENNRKNEELLKQRDVQMLEKIAIREARMEELKEQVKASLELMHGNYEAKQKSLETDVVRLRAQLRKAEMRVDTLTHDVEQKSREVVKLNGLCDELINQKIK